MEKQAGISYQVGLPEALRTEAAALYDEAFGAKFSVAIKDTEQRIQLLADTLMLPYALAAISEGKLAGLAGFQTPEGSLTKGITFQKLRQHLGLWKALRAAFIFGLFERTAEKGELVMDGITVSSDMRGKGIGTALLTMLKEHARSLGYKQIRLDVINTNPAAKRLYERQGFEATRTEEFKFLEKLLGFSAATTMVFRL